MLLIDINVIFVAIVASAVLHETIDRRVAAAIAIGVVGVALVATEGDLSTLASGNFLGSLIAFSTGLIWAFFIVFQKNVMVRESNVLGVTTAVIVETSLILTVVALLFTRSTEVNAMGAANGCMTAYYVLGWRSWPITPVCARWRHGIGADPAARGGVRHRPGDHRAFGVSQLGHRLRAALICLAILVSNWPRPKSN